MFAEWPNGPNLSLESIMGDQKQKPGLTDEEKKRENERADYQKGGASKQDPSRTQQNGPKRKTTQ